MTISTAIQDAINKELPNAVAKELQAYIAGAETNKNLLDNVRIDRDKYKKLYEELCPKYEELTKLQLSAQQLDEKQRNVKLEISEIKLLEANKRADVVFSLVDRIFKNPTVTKTLSGNMPVYVPPLSNGGSGYTSSVSTQTTTTEGLE